jgi:DNA replication protein DnaC
VKTFDQFDFAFQPSIDERQIRELRTLRFVHEASNVILLGPPDPATFCTSLLHH